MSAGSNQIQRLQERYKSSMPEKAKLLTEHLHILIDNEVPSQNLYDVVREDVHKLAGSLGMYGYSDIAEVARDVMCIIDEQDAERLAIELLNLRNLLRQQANS
ncbi:MAG: Hpt domain-containing protein [Acidiferrobacterales bacterium]|nr:Hpt domain-containing protein [Acidiferrobacterales bacterium]